MYEYLLLFIWFIYLNNLFDVRISQKIYSIVKIVH